MLVPFIQKIFCLLVRVSLLIKVPARTPRELWFTNLCKFWYTFQPIQIKYVKWQHKWRNVARQQRRVNLTLFLVFIYSFNFAQQLRIEAHFIFFTLSDGLIGMVYLWYHFLQHSTFCGKIHENFTEISSIFWRILPSQVRNQYHRWHKIDLRNQYN